MAAPTPCGATGSSPILKSSTPRLSRASSVSKPWYSMPCVMPKPVSVVRPRRPVFAAVSPLS